jgi:hypothetical protein
MKRSKNQTQDKHKQNRKGTMNTRSKQQVLFAVAAIALCLVPSLVLGQSEFQPTAWPTSWFGVLGTNSSNPNTGAVKPWESRLKWYDWAIKGLRFDGTSSGATRVINILDRQSWTYTTNPPSCVYARLPVGPVTPTWMQGGTYLGRRVLNSVRVDVWDKLDHLYAQPIPEDDPTGRCVLVFAPVDPSGFAITDNYVLFTPGQVDRAVFQVPPYCAKATEDAELDFQDVTPADKENNPRRWAAWTSFYATHPHARLVFASPEMRFALAQAGLEPITQKY